MIGFWRGRVLFLVGVLFKCWVRLFSGGGLVVACFGFLLWFFVFRRCERRSLEWELE